MKSIPEEAWLPPTLTDIIIIGWFGGFPNLKSLKGFQHLTSLKHVDIYCCDNLLYLPEEGFPTSLSSLILEGCPLLKQRCDREKGEEWPKIAQIPNIVIDDELITWAMSQQALLPRSVNFVFINAPSSWEYLFVITYNSFSKNWGFFLWHVWCRQHEHFLITSYNKFLKFFEKLDTDYSTNKNRE